MRWVGEWRCEKLSLTELMEVSTKYILVRDSSFQGKEDLSLGRRTCSGSLPFTNLIFSFL